MCRLWWFLSAISLFMCLLLLSLTVVAIWEEDWSRATLMVFISYMNGQNAVHYVEMAKDA